MFGSSTLPQKRHRCAVVLAVVALLAGCSSTAKTSPSTTSPSTTSPATAVATTAVATASTTSSGGGGTLVATTASAAAGGSISQTCPTAALVNAALAEKNPAPTSTKNSFGLTCTYGAGAATKIRFQHDTATTFAAGEAAVPSATKLTGLGDAAYGVAGFIAVLKGTVAIRITAPLATAAQVETLARQILG